MAYDAGSSVTAAVGQSVDAAIDYLRGRWAAFLALEPRIVELQHRAAVASGRARARGDETRSELARDVIGTLGELNVAHGRAVDTMRDVASYVGVNLSGYRGLGAIPAAYLTVITGLAATVVWFFRAYEAEERKLELIEAGVLTPEQAIELDVGSAPGHVIGQLNETAKLALWALAAWFAFRALEGSGVLSRRKRRARRNPPLMVFHTNPPECDDDDQGDVFGEEVYSLHYRHADDGQNYVHDFRPGVELRALRDGSVGLTHARGRRVWEEF